MAVKTFYATGSFRYGTRMLQAGDKIDLDATNARLFTALAKISPEKPKAAPAAKAEAPPAPVVAKPKAAPKKKAARRKKTA